MVFAIEAFAVSGRPFETIAEALTAIGQLSILDDCVGRTSTALKSLCGLVAVVLSC